MNQSATLTLSVVVPTFNRLERLKRVLAALAEQTLDCRLYEVVVVSDGSTDGTNEFLQGGSLPTNVVSTVQANSGPAAARNAGIKLASRDLVLFVDDDVVAAPDLLERHAAAHRRLGSQAVVIGPMLTPADQPLGRYARWEQAMLYKQYGAMTKGNYDATFRQFYTGNASVERQFLIDTGGFDERFRRAEDIELAYRLHRNGAHFHYEDTACGYHYAERSYDAWIRIARDYGRNEIRFIREFHDMERLIGVHYEFLARNWLVRFVGRSSAGRPRVESAVERAMSVAAAGADAAGAEAVVHAALSLAYSAAFYSNLARELGSRQNLAYLMSRGGVDDVEATWDSFAQQDVSPAST